MTLKRKSTIMHCVQNRESRRSEIVAALFPSYTSYSYSCCNPFLFRSYHHCCHYNYPYHTHITHPTPTLPTPTLAGAATLLLFHSYHHYDFLYYYCRHFHYPSSTSYVAASLFYHHYQSRLCILCCKLDLFQNHQLEPKSMKPLIL